MSALKYGIFPKQINVRMNPLLLTIVVGFQGWPNRKNVDLDIQPKWKLTRNPPDCAQIFVHGCPFPCACNAASPKIVI